MASILDRAKDLAYNYSGARNIMTGGRQLSKATTFTEALKGLGNIGIGAVGFLPGIGLTGKIGTSAYKAGFKNLLTKQPIKSINNPIPRIPTKEGGKIGFKKIESSMDVVRKPDAKFTGARDFTRDSIRYATSPRGISQTLIASNPSFLKSQPTQAQTPSNIQTPSNKPKPIPIYPIRPIDPSLKPTPKPSQPPKQPAAQTPAPVKMTPLPGNNNGFVTSTPPNRALIDSAFNTKPTTSTNNTIKPSTSTNIIKPTTSKNTTTSTTAGTNTLTTPTTRQPTSTQQPQISTQQPTAQNMYPHFGPNGEYLGDFKYPQATYTYQTQTPTPTSKTTIQQPATQQAPVRDLAKEEEEAVSRYNREEIERMYAQTLPNRLRLQAEEENYRQQQLNAQLNTARENELRQQLSTIDTRSTGVPPWMLAAKQRYEAGLGRSQALGNIREQDIRDLLSQRQMTARGRAAGMVGGRSTGVLGSAMTGARRGYDLNMRNETLRRIEEQAALKERYDEYLSEAARQASLQQLEDAQERARIVEQIRSLGGSI